MKRLIFAIAMVLIAVSAQAAQVSQFSWDPVTLNTDSTPVDGPITYKISCGAVTGAYTVISASITGLTMQISTVLGDQPNALYYCAVSASDVWLRTSDYSNEVTVLKNGTNFFVNVGKNPKAPGNLKAQ